MNQTFGRLIVSGLIALTTVLVPSAPALAQEIPTIPDAVVVGLDPATTAFLVLDLTSSNCPARPACVAGLPSVADLLDRARAAGALVVYSSVTTPGATILDPVAPLPSDPIVIAGADKFYGTDLQEVLQDHGITTLILVGTSSNGAVMYTSFGAGQRGYTVVVAEDGISANSDFIVMFSRFQLLNQPGSANPQNQPLLSGAVTLSRTDLITFK